ncbi:MAG: hypothetical protein LUH16_03520 [Clostridiales bacterium]|nr:hypothetical protein [Clostridiales bacterium]
MKQLTCEMCGSTDLVKQDGVFVCQVCGCKYSIEDAKKMMVEGTVEVAGTVKVDRSEELRNLYEIARRAKKDNNSQNAQKYYEQILTKDPGSWEANFYTVYYQSMNCKIGEIGSAAIRLSNCENSVLELIRDNIEASSDRLSVVLEIGEKLIDISKMLFYGYKNHYDGISADIRNQYTGDYATNCGAARDILYLYGDNVVSILGNEYEEGVAVPCWKVAVELHRILLKTPAIGAVQSNQVVIRKYVRKIHRCDRSYKDDEFNSVISKIDSEKYPSSYYESVLKELSDFSCYDETSEYIQKCEKYYEDALVRESDEKKKIAEEQRIRDEKAAKRAEKIKRTVKKIVPIVIPCVAIIIVLIVINTTVVIPNNKYSDALDMANNKQYEEALDIFESIKNYEDSQEQIYNIAKTLMEQEDYGRAAVTFGGLDGYLDSYELALEAWQHLCVNTLDAGYSHTVGVNEDGTVVSTGHNLYSQCEVNEWTDIVSVYCGSFYTLGIKIDGTVVATGQNVSLSPFGTESGFIQVAGGDSHFVALSYDGTVVASGDNTYGQCDVSQWKDIVYIACGYNYTIGVKSDGTVVACGDNENGQCDVSEWKNIVKVACGYSHTIGLTSGGSLVSCGSNEYDEGVVSKVRHAHSDDSSSYASAIDISCAGYVTTVLYSDGTVGGCGKGNWQYRIDEWTDVVSITCSSDSENVYGLCSDGSILIGGYENDYGQNDVSEWSTIRIINH